MKVIGRRLEVALDQFRGTSGCGSRYKQFHQTPLFPMTYSAFSHPVPITDSQLSGTAPKFILLKNQEREATRKAFAEVFQRRLEAIRDKPSGNALRRGHRDGPSSSD